MARRNKRRKRNIDWGAVAKVIKRALADKNNSSSSGGGSSRSSSGGASAKDRQDAIDRSNAYAVSLGGTASPTGGSVLQSSGGSSSGGSSSGGSSSGGSSVNVANNPLVFDSPAYNAQFGNSTNVEQDIQKFRSNPSNSNFVTQAQTFNTSNVNPSTYGLNAPTPVQTPETNAYQTSNYQGSSVVDYLKSSGQSADFDSRKQLALKYGVGNYTGTAEQNLGLLDRLRGESGGGEIQTMGDPNQQSDQGVDTPLSEEEIGMIGQYSPEELASLAGQAGLSYDDYIELLQNQSSGDLEANLREEYGVDELEDSVFNSSIDLQETYERAYKDAGLDDIRRKYDKKMEEANATRDDYLEALGAIDENPWLSEATRLGRGKRLAEQAELKIDNLINEAETLYADYNDGIGRVDDLVKRVSDEFDDNQKRNELKLKYLKDEIANKVAKSGYGNVSLEGYIGGKTKAEEAKDQGDPKLYGSATGGYYKYDKNTGGFIKVIGGTGTGGKEEKIDKKAIAYDEMTKTLQELSGEDGNVSPQDFSQLRKDWVSLGFEAEDFDDNFKGYTNPKNENRQDYGVYDY